MAEDDDLFMFDGAQPVRFGSSLETTSEQEDTIAKLLSESSAVNDGDYVDESPIRHSRKRRASGRREEFVELLTSGRVVDSPKKEKIEKKYGTDDSLNDSSNSRLSLSSSDSSSLNSLSPKSSHSLNSTVSDEMSHYSIHALDPETALLLDQADAALYKLKHKPDSSAVFNDSVISSESLNISATDTAFTLRVRCRGKLHKFSIKQTDPLSLVANKLASEIDVDQLQVVFRWKDQDLSHSSDPSSLSLSTLDIIDAFILKNKSPYSVNEDCGNDGGGEQIKIKIQTAKKSSYFTISKSQSLDKVLRRFAAKQGLSMDSVQFTFDGEKFATSKTAADLDLEDDDVIDARLPA